MIGFRRELWPRLALALVLTLLEAPLPGLAVSALAWGVDAVWAGADARGAALAWVGLASAGALLRVGRVAATKGLAFRVAEGLRLKLLSVWLSGPPGPVGDRIIALTDEVDQVQYGVSAGVSLLRDPLVLAILLGVGVALAPGVWGLALGLAVPVAAAAAAAGGGVRWAAARARQARATLAEEMAEVLLGAEVVATFGARGRELSRLAERAAEDRQARTRLEWMRLLPAQAAEFVAVVGAAGLLALGADQVARGQVEPGALVAFAAAVALGRRPLSGLAESWSLWQRARAALDRVQAALHDEAEVAGPPPRGSSVALRGATLLDGERVVVGPVDLEIREGEMVALVGPTGAGKSTVLRWVTGLSRPQRGAVEVGGVAPWDTPGERRAGAWVPQDAVTFARSPDDNLRMAAPGASEEELGAALATARLVGVERTRALGPGGSPWSGGERQRLALARALVSGRPLLVLDEPTSQVDADTRAWLVEALLAVRGGRTLLIATHDPALAAAADRVVELRDGRVVP